MYYLPLAEPADVVQHAQRQVLLSGHYDTVNLGSRGQAALNTAAGRGNQPAPAQPTAQQPAPPAAGSAP